MAMPSRRYHPMRGIPSGLICPLFNKVVINLVVSAVGGEIEPRAAVLR